MKLRSSGSFSVVGGSNTAVRKNVLDKNPFCAIIFWSFKISFRPLTSGLFFVRDTIFDSGSPAQDPPERLLLSGFMGGWRGSAPPTGARTERPEDLP